MKSFKKPIAITQARAYSGGVIQPISELQKLPIKERLQLVEDLWDSIALEGEDLNVPQWQKDELDLREKKFEANPGSGIPWEAAKELIRGKHA